MNVGDLTVQAPGEYFGAPSVLGTDFPKGPRVDSRFAYDPEWAYALSLIAGWAYADLPMLGQELAYYGFAGAKVTRFSMRNEPLLVVATADVVEKNRVAVLSFRGTELVNLVSWMTDANTALYAFEGKKPDAAYVHAGFYANVESLWGDIFGYLEPRIQDGRIQDLYITGHSLGAAMAVLAAAQIYRTGFKSRSKWDQALCGVYSFAQPLVGDGRFAARIGSQFEARLFRHIFDEDIVPCLPPKAVDFEFEHFGARRFAKSGEDSWHEGGEDRRASLADLGGVVANLVVRRIDLLHDFDHRVLKYSFDDHSPRGYIDASRNSVHGDSSRVVVPPFRHPGGIKAALAQWVGAIHLPGRASS